MRKNKLFYEFFYKSPYAFFYSKPDGTILDTNEAASKMLLYSVLELIEKKREELFKINDVRKYLDSRTTYGYITLEAIGIRKDGTQIPVELFSWLIKEEEETFAATFVLDASERKEKESHLQHIYTLSNDIIGVAKDGFYVELNPAFNKILGYDEEEIYHIKIFDLIHPDDLEDSLKEFGRIREGNASMNYCNRYKCKDGSYKWMEWSTTYLNGISYFVARDIDQIVKEQEQFKFLSSVINHANDGVVITKAAPFDYPGPEIVFVNNATINQSGYSREEIIGNTPRMFQGEKTDRNELNHLKESLKKGEPCEIEVINYKKNGEAFWVNVSVFPLINDKGLITHWVSIQKNVTERKKTEEALAKSNRIIQFTSKVNELILKASSKEELFSKIPEIAVSVGGFEFVWVSKIDKYSKDIITLSYAGNELGYIAFAISLLSKNEPIYSNGPSGKALKNEKIQCINDVENDPDFLPWRAEALKRGFRSIAAVPILIKKETKYLIGFYSAKVNYFNQEEISLLENMADNISFALNALYNEDKRRETELNLTKLSMAIEQSSFTVVITNTKGEIEYVNSAGMKLTGYTHDELMGKTSSIFSTGYTTKEEYEQLWNTIKNGNTWHGIFCNKKKNNELYWEAAVISPVLNEEGIISNFIAVKEDISERKRNEEELLKLNEELQSLSSHLLTVREEERKHIAKEIHDELGQTLTLLKLDISWVIAHLDVDKSTLTDRLQQIKKLTDETVQTSRRLYNYIYPQMIDDIGLIETIRWHSKSYLNNQNIALEIWTNFSNDTTIKNPNTSLVLFRVYQESFTNILRYAQATKVAIDISIDDTNVIMTLKDNGVGFIIEEVDTKLHHGLLGMRERVKALNGTISIDSILNKGTTTKVCLPI